MSFSWSWFALNIALPIVLSIISSYIYRYADGTIYKIGRFTSKKLTERRISKIRRYETIIRDKIESPFLIIVSSRRIASLILTVASYAMVINLIYASKYSGAMNNSTLVNSLNYLFTSIGTISSILSMSDQYLLFSFYRYMENRSSQLQLKEILVDAEKYKIENDDVDFLRLIGASTPPAP